MNPGYFLTCHGPSSLEHQNCHCASGSPEDTSALNILVAVGAPTFRFTLQVNSLTNLFCVTSACQSPGASYLREACGLEWGGSPQLEEIMKKVDSSGLFTDHIPGLGGKFSHDGTCPHLPVILPPLWFVGGKGPGLMCCQATVRWLLLTLPIFRNNVLCGSPHQWIYGQIGHFGRLKTCINLSYSIPGLKLKFGFLFF